MRILDKLLNYLETANATKDAANEEMKTKSDKELKAIVKSGGTSAQTMGKKQAALEELRSRGYNV